MSEDPGPPPAGLVVRAQGEGFYARVWPVPRPAPAKVVGGIAAIAAVSGLAAWLSGPDPWLQLEVAACLALFGVLLALFGFGAGFVPVELTVDDHAVNWGGDRIPIATVADCVVRGRILELVGRGGAVLARIEGVDPAAGRWLSLAIRASLPRDVSPPVQ